MYGYTKIQKKRIKISCKAKTSNLLFVLEERLTELQVSHCLDLDLNGQKTRRNFWCIPADMALFNLCMKIKKILGQIILFEVVKNSQL